MTQNCVGELSNDEKFCFARLQFNEEEGRERVRRLVTGKADFSLLVG